MAAKSDFRRDSPSFDMLPYRPCVGIMLANRHGDVFVGRRIDSDLNAWQMPQGGIDPDENPSAAALRELEEETGVCPESVRFVASMDRWIAYDLPREMVPKIWGGRYKGQTQKWFLYRFCGSDSQIDINAEHPEFSDWRWLSVEKVLEQAVWFKKSTYKQVVDEFRPLL